METSMKKAMAGSAVRAICIRPRCSANTAHAGTVRSAQGRTVPFAGDDGRDLLVAHVRTTGVGAAAPITAVVYPRLEAPPV